MPFGSKSRSQSDKPRLYVVLYLRSAAPTMPGLEDTYHWGLIIGPKSEKETSIEGTRVHVKDKPPKPGQLKEWEYEERAIHFVSTPNLLTRVMVGKVNDLERLLEVTRRVPVVQGDKDWNCVVWVKAALEALREDGQAMGTSKLEWQEVRDSCMRYIQEKRNARRFEAGAGFDMSRPPTLDLLEGKELVV